VDPTRPRPLTPYPEVSAQGDRGLTVSRPPPRCAMSFMPTTLATKLWSVRLNKRKRTKLLGFVSAPDEISAIAAAAEKFNLSDYRRWQIVVRAPRS
jgi:hypothetical protein